MCSGETIGCSEGPPPLVFDVRWPLGGWRMRAAYYESVGPASEVMRVGERPTPQPGPGEVRVRVHASGVNPSDVKARAGARGALAHPYVIPHSDGAGIIDLVGSGVEPGENRRARVDLERRVAPALWNLRRVRLPAVGAGGHASPEHRVRRRCLPRNSRHDGLSRGARRRPARRQVRIGDRRCRRRGPLRDSVRQVVGRASDRDRQRRGQSNPRQGGRRGSRRQLSRTGCGRDHQGV